MKLAAYPGNTPDDQLTAAIRTEIGDGNTAGSQFPQPIAPDLGRDWRFTRRQRITHGFQLDTGVSTVGQQRGPRTLPVTVSLKTPGGWFDVAGDSYGNAYGVNLRNLSITGSSDSRLFTPSSAVLVDSELHGISTVNFTPFGGPGGKTLLRLCTLSGYWNMNNLPYPLQLGGSDNPLWTDGAGIDSPWKMLTPPDAKRPDGGWSYLIEFLQMSKSKVGPLYITGERNTPVHVVGSNDLLELTSPKMEGRNYKLPAFGALCRVERNASLDLVSPWFGFGMAAPAKTGRDDKAILHVTGGSQVSSTGGQYRPANGVGADVPFAWVGRDCYLSVKGLKSPGMTDRPLVVAEHGANVGDCDDSVRITWI